MLIDGGEALPRIAEAVAGARSHVHIAGWHVTPDFGLTRDDEASRLRDLLGELAERVEVRVLLWGGGWRVPTGMGHHPATLALCWLSGRPSTGHAH